MLSISFVDRPPRRHLAPPLQTPAATCCTSPPPCCTSTIASWPGGSARGQLPGIWKLQSPWTTARRRTGPATTATRSASCGATRWAGPARMLRAAARCGAQRRAGQRTAQCSISSHSSAEQSRAEAVKGGQRRGKSALFRCRALPQTLPAAWGPGPILPVRPRAPPGLALPHYLPPPHASGREALALASAPAAPLGPGASLPTPLRPCIPAGGVQEQCQVHGRGR